MEQLKQGLVAAVAAGAALATGQAAAEIYVGASVGDATLDIAIEDSYYYVDQPVENGGKQPDQEFESNDTAYKIFGGYMFNEYVGVELGYVDLGSQSDTSNDTYYGYYGYDGAETLETTMTGWTAQLIGQYPIGPVDIFAKAGFIDWAWEVEETTYYDYSESSGDRVSSYNWTDQGNDWVYGVGATYNFGDFGIRAEYEMYDLKATGVDDLYMWSIGFEYRVRP